MHFHRKDVEGLFYGPGEMSVKDLDGDCCEDVVVSHETGGINLMGNDVQWYHGDCQGNFSSGKTVAHDDCPAGNTIIDVDGDCAWTAPSSSSTPVEAFPQATRTSSAASSTATPRAAARALSTGTRTTASRCLPRSTPSKGTKL